MQKKLMGQTNCKTDLFEKRCELHKFQRNKCKAFENLENMINQL